MNTLPPMGDPIVMAALAHLEAGHDVRATAVTEGHLAEVADAEAEQDALTAERDELRAGAQVDAWLGESVARLLTAETARGRSERDALAVELRLAQTEARLLKGEVRVWRDRALREERAGQQRILALAAERDNLREQIAAMTAPDRLSIMDGWLVWSAGEHTCGGYGPESGYAHEPGCGYLPMLDLSRMEGWPGAERDALAAKVDAAEAALKRVRELAEGPWTHACHDLDADCAACWAHDLLARLMSVAMTTQAVIERRLASVRPVSEEARCD